MISGFELPIIRVDQSAIKFVAPNQLPAAMGSGRSATQESHHGQSQPR
jgi:hypothetical protein